MGDAPNLAFGHYEKNEANTLDITKDFLQGDTSLDKSYLKDVDFDQIYRALNFLLNNPHLTDAQKAALTKRSWSIVYRRKPPTIEEFLTPKYLGRQAADGNIYPRVHQVITEFLDPNTEYRNLILSPFIGFGKSTAAVIITLYIATLLSFMRDPKKYFNQAPSAVLCQALISYSLKKSSEVLLEPYMNILDISDFFEKVHTREGMVKKDKEFEEMGEDIDRVFWTTAVPTSALQFSNGANIKMISSVQNLLGLTIITAVLSELSFFRDAGKALTLDTKIPTPSGYKTMGELKIGDEVYTPKGSTTKIIDVLPQGVTSVYEIEFADGRTIKANPEHEWKVSKNKDCWKIMTTEELYRSHHEDNPRHRWAVPFPHPIEWPEKPHLIHPYLMGVLLGDGSFRQGQTLVSVGEDDDRIEMLRRIEEVLPPGYKYVYVESGRYIRIVQNAPIRNEKGYLQSPSITEELKRLGLIDRRSGDKFIPDEYLIDSPENRWELLRGLMDADGCAYKGKKSAILSTSSPFLVSGCAELVRCLGGYATSSSQLASWPSGQGQTRIHHVYVTFPTNDHNLFHLRRKQERVNEAFAKITRNNRSKLRIKSIKKVEDEPTQCITIEDEEHLFVAGEGIVTKNSDEYIMRIYNDTKGRIESRMKGNWFGRSILDSSPDSFDNPIDSYIWGEAKKDPTNYIVTGSRWEWEEDEFVDDKKFPVYLGGPGKPPAILQSTEGYDVTDLLWVPEKLRTYFQNDLVKAIKDIGGRPSGNMSKLLYDTSHIENMFDDRLNNIYTHLHVPSYINPDGAIWDQVYKSFFREAGGGLRFYYRPEIPRVFSVDQSENDDTTCISIAHHEMLNDGSVLYVFDMTLVLEPIKNDINLDAIRYFIRDLHTKGNVNFIEGSFDQYQSTPAKQFLERELDIPVRKLSVDRSMEPYRNLVSDIRAGRVKVGKNIYIKNNLKSLTYKQRKGSKSYKVDHTLGDKADPFGDTRWETSLIGIHAKDATDAMAANSELLRQVGAPLHYHNDFEELRYIDAIVEDEDEYKDFLAANRGLKTTSVPWD